jgi:cyclophilin family peptidyl-prolyl cis-trans isomerase
MKNLIQLLTLSIFILSSCTQTAKEEQAQTPDVLVETDMGTMVFRLYDETPLHRDNFIKLVEDQFYDSLLFHRVINNFMIQTGDPDSKNRESDSELGESDLPYTIPAEISPTLFHKKGALGAARDGNPARASSSTQFYIVQGKVYSSDSLIKVQEKRINGWLAMNRVENDSANKVLLDRRVELYENYTDSDSTELKHITDQLKELAKVDEESTTPYVIPEDQREVYRTIGGTPHLDQNYTVFGEVVSGLDVIDKIAAVETNENDRPRMDIKIISTKLIERKEY